MPTWSVLRVQTGSEAKASEHVARQGFPLFLPRESYRRVVNGRRVVRERPLFPGYLFAELIGRAWHSLLDARHVIDVLRWGDVPAQVKPGCVEQLMAMCDGTGAIQLKQPPRFSRGQSVRVERNGSPMFGHVGLFDTNLSTAGRVQVLFSMLGMQVPVVMDEAELAAA